MGSSSTAVLLRRGVVAFLFCFLALLSAAESRDRGVGGVVQLGPAAGRVLLQQGNSGATSETPQNTSDRTVRVDPLDKLKKYRGGYDITSKHYWSSVIFTGIYGYSIAALWLLCGAIYSVYLIVASFLPTRKEGKHIKVSPCTSRNCFWPMTTVALLTLLAIVASGVALAGSSKFHSSANSIKNIIAETAEEASATIYNVTGAVRAMQTDTELYSNIEGSTRLNSTTQKLNDEASKIRDKAEKNVRIINRGLKILQAVTIVIVSLNLVTVLGLLCSKFLKFRRPSHIFLLICWLLTFFFWGLFGLYFFLYGFAGDTCMALEEYRQDPRGSSLTSILPCSDQFSANSALKDTRAGIYNLINQVNANISATQATLRLQNLGLVCNPFSSPPEYRYQPGNCSDNEIRIGDIPQILKRYACSGSDGGKCGTGEFISANDFTTVSIYTASVQNLLDSFPGVERLVSCQLVKDAFSEILTKQCSSLKKYARMSWAALVVLSALMVFLAVTWVLIIRHDEQHHLADGSVNPHLAVGTDGRSSSSEQPKSGLEP